MGEGVSVASFTVKIDDAKMRDFLRGSGQPTDQFMMRLANRVVNGAKVRCNVDSGVLRNSIAAVSDSQSATWSVTARTHYARYVHEGRGPIEAAPGRVLAFTPKGGGAVVFTRRVGPYKGNPFLRDAMVAEVGRL